METELAPEAATPIGPDPGEVGKAAAAAVAPDPLTAQILEKHARGEKLTSSEGGKIGAWRYRLKHLFGGPGKDGKDGAPAGPVKPRAAARQPAPVAAVAPAEASPGDLVPVEIDAGLVQRTTGALLNRIESIARRHMGNAARAAGVEGDTLVRFDRAACLPADDRKLILELAPDVCRSLGLDPRHYPIVLVVGTVGLWTSDIWLAIQELKQIAADRKKQAKPGEAS